MVRYLAVGKYHLDRGKDGREWDCDTDDLCMHSPWPATWQSGVLFHLVLENMDHRESPAPVVLVSFSPPDSLFHEPVVCHFILKHLAREIQDVIFGTRALACLLHGVSCAAVK